MKTLNKHQILREREKIIRLNRERKLFLIPTFLKQNYPSDEGLFFDQKKREPKSSLLFLFIKQLLD